MKNLTTKNIISIGSEAFCDCYGRNTLQLIGKTFSLIVFSLLLLFVAVSSIFAQATGKIAFQVDNNNIYTINADGTMRTQITSNGNNVGAEEPTWSPDGSRIAFECGNENNSAICVINADGTGLTTIPNTIGNNGQPSWSPDGNRIAFSRSVGNDFSIFTINVNGSNLTQLTTGDIDFNPSWSPDGSRLVFDRAAGLFTVNATGGNPTLLLSGDYFEPDWSPNGAKIVLTGAINNTGEEIYVVNIDGTGLTQLTNSGSGNSGQPTWSSDGTKIAYIFGSNSSDIYMMNADGSNTANITNTPSVDEEDPDWQPALTISGRVINGLNAVPIAGVTLTISGTNINPPITTQTNQVGDYTFGNLTAGGTYIVTPLLANYTFNPISSTFSNLQMNATQNFSAVSNCVLSSMSQPVAAGGGTGSITITANGDCGAWTAVSNVPWITITGGSPGNSNGTVTFSVQPNSTAQARSGTITIAGQVFTVNQAATVIRRTPFDFDGDGKADVSVFRPSNGVWYLNQSQNGFTGLQFGISTDRIVPADYDGDGKTDIAVFRNGVWYLQRSQAGFTGIAFGAPDDIPVPADYDGDGKADLAVFRPSTGIWYIQRSQLGFTGIAFGQTGDKPVATDYDGDGKADVAVFRPSNGVWYLQRSQLGFTGVAFGDSNDKPVPADYDGDGRADIAVFRPSNGVWYTSQNPATNYGAVLFGQSGDAPVPADYDGDGKTDVAVFRNGTWYLQRSQAGFTGVAFGSVGDKPVPNAFVQ